MASPSVTPVASRQAFSWSTVIQQRISAAGNFDGTLPQAAGVRADSPLSQANAVYKYPAAAKGGLFFWNANEPLMCTQIHVDFGAASDVVVKLCNLVPSTVNDDLPTTVAGEDITIEQATGVTFLALDETKLKVVVFPYQAIKIVSTANAAAQIARVVASLERTFVR
jgi:hypothetical protein